MSEQINQSIGSQVSEVEEDPLAELARIVAGEPELNTPAPEPEPLEEPSVSLSAPVVADVEASTDHTPVSELVEEVAESINPTDASVEAALEEQLLAEFSNQESIDAVIDEVETPAFVDDINSSIEEINAEKQDIETEVEAVATAPAFEEPVQEPVPEVAEAVDSEVGFQDGLISALEMEIVGEPAVEAVQAIEPVTETVEQSEEAIEAVVDTVDDVDTNIASMQEALEQELAAGVETPALIEKAAVASIEDDLGAAFASEFEQMEVTEAVAKPVVSENVAQEAVVSGDPDLEMDFEAAFSQELKEVSVEEPQGWVANETVESNAAFVAAASPNVPMSETINLENDPGHVGSLDEIAAIEGEKAAANDNGGGLKLAVAAFVIALFAGGIAAGYGFLGGETSTITTGTPTIIKADVDPVKVKPKDPGGVVPENQDNASYSDLGGENTAKVSQQTLNSQTEEPLVLNTGNVVDLTKTDDRLTASEDVGATPNAGETSVEPKVVQTVVVKPDGTIITKPAAPKPIETASNIVTINEAPIVDVQPVSTQAIAGASGIDGALSTGDIKVPSVSPLPKPAVQPRAVVKPKPAPAAPVRKVAAAPKPKKATPAPVRKSEWVVQVSSQRSPEAAQASFVDMRNKFTALRGRAMSIQRASVNGATYYRVRVQTASKSDANRLCSSLSSAGGACFVTR